VIWGPDISIIANANAAYNYISRPILSALYTSIFLFQDYLKINFQIGGPRTPGPPLATPMSAKCRGGDVPSVHGW